MNNSKKSHHPALLVIDDEASICFAFERFFEPRGYRVLTAGNGQDGLDRCRRDNPDMVFLDIRLPDMDGLEVLGKLRDASPDSCLVVITAYGSLQTVTRAIQEQAFDCLIKPLDLDQVHNLVQQYLHAQPRSGTEHSQGSDSIDLQAETDTPLVIGNSPAMQEVFKAIARAAATEASVLITGETGTGKDLIARSIHQLCNRQQRPFAAVNCGALPENLIESELFGHRKGAFTGASQDKPGRFEGADGGTLFLDEIGELPPSSQVKLLRFLDSHIIERLGDITPRHLDIRILAATNQPLAEAMRAGEFRQDLFYRLAVVEIHIPPLRERGRDIINLAEYFLSLSTAGEQKKSPTISAQAIALLQAYHWPGNVRELRNAIEHTLTMITGDLILPVHLPYHIREQNPTSAATATDTAADAVSAAQNYLDQAGTNGHNLYPHLVKPVEHELIRRILDECDGNQSLAATRLGLHRNTLRRKLREMK